MAEGDFQIECAILGKITSFLFYITFAPLNYLKILMA